MCKTVKENIVKRGLEGAHRVIVICMSTLGKKVAHNFVTRNLFSSYLYLD